MDSSKRIIRDKKVPIIPEKVPKIKYKDPISLWFVEDVHLKAQIFIFDIKSA